MINALRKSYMVRNNKGLPNVYVIKYLSLYYRFELGWLVGTYNTFREALEGVNR